MPKLKKPRDTSASHQIQAAILRVLIEDGAVLQRNLPEKTGIGNKGPISRELNHSLQAYVERKDSVLLSDYLKGKRYAGKKWRGDIITLKGGLSVYREILRNFPVLLGPLMKCLPLAESIKKAYAEVYRLDEVTGPLFASALALIPTFFRWHIEDEPNVFRKRIYEWFPIAGEGSYIGETVSPRSFGRGGAFDHLFIGDSGRIISPPSGGILLSGPVLKSLILKAAYNDFVSGQLTDAGLELVKGLEEEADRERSAKAKKGEASNFERVCKNLIEIAPLFRSDLAEDIVRSVPVWKKLYSKGHRKEIGNRCRKLWGKYPGLETLMNELW